ncbi:MAG: patatin-like phospholipase family protein, partial [Paracoccaceae bacterium]
VIQLGLAIANSPLSSAARLGYDLLRVTLDRYAEELIEWRCALPPSRVRQLRGTLSGWDCADLKLFVGQVSFAALDSDRRDDLDEVPTRLRLETEQVDAVIAAGLDATRLNPDFNGFLRSIDIEKPLSALGGPAPRRILPSN